MTQGAQARWLEGLAAAAAKTDRFAGKNDHVALLAAGLLGEAGSIVAELKKVRREREAYPVYYEKMIEEVGDFLWYFIRLTTISAPTLLCDLQEGETSLSTDGDAFQLSVHLEFGGAVGALLAAISASNFDEITLLLRRIWSLLNAISREANLSLQNAAAHNTAKTQSRWPVEKQYAALFDDKCLPEEQLPRHLNIEFIERDRGDQRVVILRCNGINFGDRLTDNIQDPDGYRFHDIFHFAYAVHLGWSPVVRALMRSKRKYDPKVDESQDGARAVILEEAVSAIVFSRAKRLKFFDGLDHVDFDLLKTVKEFTDGFEVATIPLWQWEAAILDGYRVFRALRDSGGGRVTLDLTKRQLIHTLIRE